jgi:micrococcal nuclease
MPPSRRALPIRIVGLLLVIIIPLLLWQQKAVEKPTGGNSRVPTAAVQRGLSFSAVVQRVVDGDTLTLAGGERVRLLGIDCPEHDTPFFEEARAACREIAERRKADVTATSDPPRDHYGRLLALVQVGEVLVNEELIARGLAWVYLKGPREMPPEVERGLIRSQNLAIDRRVGLWSRPGAISTSPGETLLATRYRFHRPGCSSLSGEWKPTAAPRPISREEAYRSGRSACRTCKPRRLRVGPPRKRRVRGDRGRPRARFDLRLATCAPTDDDNR